MKATTIVFLLFVVFAVASANNFAVEAHKVENWFANIWQSLLTAYQNAYNAVYNQIYTAQTDVGLQIVCRTAYAMKFS